MPAVRNPPLDFKIGRMRADPEHPRRKVGTLHRGRHSVPVCGLVYTLAVYLRQQRCVSVKAVKVRIWGDVEKPTNSVSDICRRLNERLLAVGSTCRVGIQDGRVFLIDLKARDGGRGGVA